MSDSPHHRKKNRLLTLFSGLRKRSQSRKPPTTSTQDGPLPIKKSGGHTGGRPCCSESGKLPGVEHYQIPSLSHPYIHVEDRSNHHHGHTYNSIHNVQGVANIIGTVTNSTLFSSGNEAALLWDTLPKQRDLSGQQSEYLEGSREGTVQYALTWGEHPKSELALFIYGAAGAGKSTLARHLTHRLHATGRLAASVSLSGIPTDARGPESVIKLIAREIGETHPEAMPAILEAIRLCKGAPLEDHFERFLKDVVCSLKRSHPLVVLFDAIDEWESYGSLIKALPRLYSSASSLRFILLGRLDPRERGFNDASIRLYTLHPVSKGVMERYFGHQFDSVRWDSGRRPSPSQTAQLAELANGLFIWASIVCSLLKKRLSFSSPDQTLEAILHLRQRLGENDGLARLYYQAFVWLFPDPDAQALVRKYLGATLVLQEPLPITDFSSLTDLPAHAAEEIKFGLTAFQIRQPTDHEGRSLVHPAGDLFHLSLLEYLQSTSASTDAAFHISTFSAHSHLAESCLTKLPQFLAASGNISSLPLSPREEYIVKYLATHIYKGTPSVKPGSSTRWLRTRHHHLLQQLSISQLRHWGNLLLGLVKPGCSIQEGEYSGDEAGRLMRDIAAILGGGSAIRSLGIPCLEVAVRLQPGDAEAWGALGWAYWNAVEHSKDIGAGDKAVLAHQNALVIVEASGSPNWSYVLFSLATSLHSRFKLVGNTRDLDLSISLHRDALALRPPGHKRRAISLNNLALALRSRLEIIDSIGNIDEVIHLQREVLHLRPPGYAYRASSLMNLARTLYSRFQKTTSIAYLDEAVRLRREVLELRPTGHADRVTALQDLATSLDSRFQVMGSIADLNEDIFLSREVLELRPPGHPNRVSALQGLATSLHSRFQVMASIVDLSESIHLYRDTLKSPTIDDADRAAYLSELAWNLTFRYEAQGLAQDLEESISLGRESLALLPVDDPDRYNTLDTLARALHFEPEHLKEALQLSRESVALISPSRQEYCEHLMTLATILLRHYESSGSVEELREATSVCAEALSKCLPNHLLRPKFLDLRAKLAEAKSSSPSQL